MDQRKRMVFVFCLAVILGCLVFLWQRFYELSRSEEREFEIYDRHYVMITGREDSDFWDRVYESAQEEGKERGVYVERFGEDLSVKYSRNELLRLAMQASVDGIIVPGDEEEETIALLQEVVEQGIPVVNVLQDSTGSIRQCFVGNNSYNLGQDYGRQILELLAEKEDDNPQEGEPADVLVLVDSVERPEEIDEARARWEADQAREIILQKKSRQEYQIAQGNLARALNRLRISSRGLG